MEIDDAFTIKILTTYISSWGYFILGVMILINAMMLSVIWTGSNIFALSYVLALIFISGLTLTKAYKKQKEVLESE